MFEWCALAAILCAVCIYAFDSMSCISVPCHEGPPATRGHFCSEPEVAARGRYYCTSFDIYGYFFCLFAVHITNQIFLVTDSRDSKGNQSYSKHIIVEPHIIIFIFGEFAIQ